MNVQAARRSDYPSFGRSEKPRVTPLKHVKDKTEAAEALRALSSIESRPGSLHSGLLSGEEVKSSVRIPTPFGPLEITFHFRPKLSDIMIRVNSRLCHARSRIKLDHADQPESVTLINDTERLIPNALRMVNQGWFANLFGSKSDDNPVKKEAFYQNRTVDQSDVSSKMRTEVMQAFIDLPPHVRDTVLSDYRLVLVQLLSEIYAGSQVVDGHGLTTRIDQCVGYHDPTNPRDRKIIVAEYYKDALGNMVENPSVPEILRHEVGHAIDLHLGNPSFTQDFFTAYQEDLQENAALIRTLASHLMPGAGELAQPRLRELFAIAYAELVRPTTAWSVSSVKFLFPKFTSLVHSKAVEPFNQT